MTDWIAVQGSRQATMKARHRWRRSGRSSGDRAMGVGAAQNSRSASPCHSRTRIRVAVPSDAMGYSACALVSREDDQVHPFTSASMISLRSAYSRGSGDDQTSGRQPHRPSDELGPLTSAPDPDQDGPLIIRLRGSRSGASKATGRSTDWINPSASRSTPVSSLNSRSAHSWKVSLASRKPPGRAHIIVLPSKDECDLVTPNDYGVRRQLGPLPYWAS